MQFYTEIAHRFGSAITVYFRKAFDMLLKVVAVISDKGQCS